MIFTLALVAIAAFTFWLSVCNYGYGWLIMPATLLGVVAALRIVVLHGDVIRAVGKWVLT